jgi:putative RecB family exonuclease
VDRLPQPEKGYFSFGTCIHACVEYFYRVKTPPPPSLEKLLDFYDKNWIPEGYESPEDEANYRAYGEEILAAFWKTHAPAFKMPVAVEKLFFLDVDGVKVRGYIDHVDKLDSGALAVIDYKTNRDLFTAEYVENDLQLTIYQLAAEQLWRLPVETLTLYHLRSNTPCTAPGRRPEVLQETRELILDVADRIVRQEFPATENRYCPCDYPEYCPYYRHQVVLEVPKEGEQTPLPDPGAIDAAAAVERYAGLQAQIKDLQDELERTRRAIVEYCQAEDLKRVYGPGHELTYRLMERTGFDGTEVKTLLKPAGLWDAVSKLDEGRLKALIGDESLDTDLRQALEKLRRVTSTYPVLRLKRRAAAEDEETEETES